MRFIYLHGNAGHAVAGYGAGGDGSLEAKAINGNGIAANSIKLQYPAELIVEGAVMATSTRVECSEGAKAYKAAHSVSSVIGNYFSDNNRFKTERYVSFTPRADTWFPLWVNGERVTALNKGNLSVPGGSVTYTPARGSAPAKLTLTGGKQYYNAAGESAAVWDKTVDTTLYAQWTAVPPL